MFQEILKKKASALIWDKSYINRNIFESNDASKNFSEICFLCSDCSCGLVVLL